MFSKRRLRFRLAFLVLLLAGFVFCTPSAALSDEGGLQIGLARVKITPEEPIRMAGYASRNKPSEGVLLDLYAKAMALEDEQGERAVVITADVIGYSATGGQFHLRKDHGADTARTSADSAGPVAYAHWPGDWDPQRNRL